MNKIFASVLVFVLVVLVGVVIFVQISDSSNSAAYSGSPEALASPTATPVSASDLIAQATVNLNELMKTWYINNNRSYAEFMSQKNVTMIAKALPQNVTISFHIASTRDHYVIRTHEPGSMLMNCIDDSSPYLEQRSFINDANFRLNKDCGGNPL